VLLRRLYILVFICIGSRRIEYVACTSNPDGDWMLQQARNLLMYLDDRGSRRRFLIHDRDAKFSRAFDAVFGSSGIRVVRTPVCAPNANAHVERGSEAFDGSASTGYSSSTAASSRGSSASTSATTTSGGHTGRWPYKRPTRLRDLRREASPLHRPRRFSDVTSSAG
jgi:hypothetical protein